MMEMAGEQTEKVAARPTLKEQVAVLEREIIREALMRYRWRYGRVANALGLSRTGLANKLRRYGLNRGGDGA